MWRGWGPRRVRGKAPSFWDGIFNFCWQSWNGLGLGFVHVLLHPTSSARFSFLVVFSSFSSSPTLQREGTNWRHFPASISELSKSARCCFCCCFCCCWCCLCCSSCFFCCCLCCCCCCCFRCFCSCCISSCFCSFCCLST